MIEHLKTLLVGIILLLAMMLVVWVLVEFNILHYVVSVILLLSASYVIGVTFRSIISR